MSFFKLLESIQNKPERTRTNILIVSVAVIMAVIIALWLTLPDLRPEKQQEEQTAGPFKMLWEQVKGLRNALPSL
ncbi:MAG: hypothetical protein HY445_00560 [Candidatus Niyogibacteria bacterium]|nr:hypothetical protein [Candidatus Niyogibacteria bacterium]